MKIGIIGVGRIGALFEEDTRREKPCSHLGAWKEIADDIEIQDENQERAEKVAAKWKVKMAPVYNPAGLDISQGIFDVVSVATPVETHLDIVVSLAQGKMTKAIFCEKPIAPSIEEADSMIRVCKENEVKLAINHTRAWDPIFRHAKKIIDGASPLQSRNISLGKFIGGTAYYCGDTIEMGCHVAHLANWFGLDEHFQVYNVKNTDYLLFELDLIFERGRIKILDNGRAYEVYESKPSLNYEFYNELVAIPLNPYELGLRDEKNPFRTATPMLRACRQVYESAISSDVKPYCTGEDGRDALARALRWKAAAAI